MTAHADPPVDAPPPPPPARGSDGRPRLAAALAALAMLGVIALAVALAAGAFTKSATSIVAAPAGDTGLDAAAIYAAANPGVVDITAHATTTSDTGPFGLPQKSPSTDSGTGFVLDTKGNILTAGHVVAGASSVTVTLQGGQTRAAKVLGGDSATDVAVLHIDPSGLTLHPLALGSLSGHRVGDPVAVIGDPFDVQRSLSTGIISGLDRTIQAPNGYSIPHAVQTDAAMNPGNSGGPILDAGGRVIGIADQIATGGSTSPSSTGVGFAVPVDIIRAELSQLEAGKVPGHSDLGVGLSESSGSARGALVQSVRAGGPAAAAGVRVGDVIVGLNGAKVTDVPSIVAAIVATHPGERVALVVLRGGRHLTLDVTLGRQSTAVSSAP